MRRLGTGPYCVVAMVTRLDLAVSCGVALMTPHAYRCFRSNARASGRGTGRANVTACLSSGRCRMMGIVTVAMRPDHPSDLAASGPGDDRHRCHRTSCTVVIGPASGDHHTMRNADAPGNPILQPPRRLRLPVAMIVMAAPERQTPTPGLYHLNGSASAITVVSSTGCMNPCCRRLLNEHTIMPSVSIHIGVVEPVACRRTMDRPLTLTGRAAR